MTSGPGRRGAPFRLFVALVSALVWLGGCKDEAPIVNDQGCGASCADGSRCVKGRCLPGACASGACGGHEVCLDEACVDESCVDVACAADAVCVEGSCLPATCGTPDCGEGEACMAGACVDVRCVGAQCSAEERCVRGLCYPASCSSGACPMPEVCEGDACVTPACVGVVCEEGLSCFDGVCANCPTGMRPLNDGTCVPFIDLGDECSESIECGSGHCADGVCCDAACDGACDTCSAQGTCGPVPAGSVDEACGAFVCDANGDCLTVCDAPEDCGPNATCTGDGVCEQTKPDGTPCSLASECASGVCADGVCCDRACDGACEACGISGTTGTCTPRAAGSVPRDGCAGRLCDGTSGTCEEQCLSESDCEVSHFCDDAGACVPRKDPGAQCARAAECASSHCVDGVCCDSECGAACQSCALEATVGVCTTAEPLSVDDLCSPYLCGEGACLATCSTNDECTPGDACVDGECIGRKGNGQSCGENNECSSDFCVDGICCNTACTEGADGCWLAAECSTGTCRTPPAAGGVACEDDDNVCTSDECDGAGKCVHRGIAGTCDDGQSCTTPDSCQSGQCVGTTSCAAPPGQCWQPAGSCAADGTCEYAPKSEGATCADDGNPCTVDACDGSGACVHLAGHAGASCREATGACDVEEVCDGTSTACPADTFAAENTACGSSTSTACDAADSCDGAGKCVDRFKATSYECRAAVDACDAAETCTGNSAQCPVDRFASSGTACGDQSSIACDAPDSCDGSGECVARFKPSTHECRDAADACDVAETCTGTTALCPPDGFVSNGDECNDGQSCTTGDVCQAGECVGSTSCNSPPNQCWQAAGSCAANGTCEYVPKSEGVSCADDGNPCTVDACDGSGMCVHLAGNAGATCRESAGVCDVAEVCSGNSTACPADDYADAGTACGNQSSTACNAPDSCDGSGACVARFKSTSHVCRAAANACDVAETCTGTTAICPADGFVSNGDDCNDGQSCTTGDVCQAGQCVGSTSCNAPPGQCWQPAGSCAADGTCEYVPKSEGVSCADDGNPCTVDACDGSGMCVHLAGNAGATCRESAGVCDVAEVCSGNSTACPADDYADSGTACGDQASTACNAPDSCDGAGACVARFKPASHVCRAAADACDVAETCTGGSAVCPGNSYASTGTACGDQTSTACNLPNTCNGSGTCVNRIAAAGTACGGSSSGCDALNTCNSAGACVDHVDPAGTLCRSGGTCDPAEYCNGSSKSCPSDAKSPAGTACGDQSSAGCNAPDSCNGSGTCVNRVDPAGTACGGSSSGCDALDTCNSSGSCVDRIDPAGTVCRAGATCNPAEVCSGTSKSCPSDAISPNGSRCGGPSTCRVCIDGACGGGCAYPTHCCGDYCAPKDQMCQ